MRLSQWRTQASISPASIPRLPDCNLRAPPAPVLKKSTMKSVFRPKPTPPAPAEDRTLAKRFESRVRLSWLALLAERIWEALLWPFLVVSTFLVVTLLDAVEHHPAACPSRAARRLRSCACDLLPAAHPPQPADPRGGPATARAQGQHQAPPRLILRGSSRHHPCQGDGAAVGHASRAAVAADRSLAAVLARSADRPQGPLCHQGSAPHRPRRSVVRRRRQWLGPAARRLLSRSEQRAVAPPPRCLGDAARLYRCRAHRARRRQRDDRRGRRDLPRAVGARAERADRARARAAGREGHPHHQQRGRLARDSRRAQDRQDRQDRGPDRVQRGAQRARQRRREDRRPDHRQMALRPDQGRAPDHQPDGQSHHHPARRLAPRLPRRRRSWRGQCRGEIRSGRGRGCGPRRFTHCRPAAGGCRAGGPCPAERGWPQGPDFQRYQGRSGQSRSAARAAADAAAIAARQCQARRGPRHAGPDRPSLGRAQGAHDAGRPRPGRASRDERALRVRPA